ncbi:mediator complex, subunit Med22 [Scheffersomyces amazonensis]|uniref:mediator complex, subunit Med22 n=1 Tax=Scheffersomyces amazonensis TaxID=1078765 RepID=UPI00315D261C
MQPQSIALLQRIDTDVEQILQKFEHIFEVARNQDKRKELLAVESLTIESDALTIIRFCEDLLSISRAVKETWCLGTLKVDANDDKMMSQKDVNKVFEKLNNLTDHISKFQEKSELSTV